MRVNILKCKSVLINNYCLTTFSVSITVIDYINICIITSGMYTGNIIFTNDALVTVVTIKY